MSKKVKKIIIISLIAVALLAAAVFSVMKSKKPAAPVDLDLPLAAPAENTATEITLSGFSQAEAPSRGLEQGAEALKADAAQTDAGQTQFKTCAHAGYGFSFACPVDWISDLFKDGDGEVAVIQNAETGILIYIDPFDEPGAITKERILKDVPGMALENSQQIKIAGTIEALSFLSNERETGPTKEVWFVHKNFLYQISAAEGSDEVLAKMIATWKFD